MRRDGCHSGSRLKTDFGLTEVWLSAYLGPAEDWLFRAARLQHLNADMGSLIPCRRLRIAPQWILGHRTYLLPVRLASRITGNYGSHAPEHRPKRVAVRHSNHTTDRYHPPTIPIIPIPRRHATGRAHRMRILPPGGLLAPILTQRATRQSHHRQIPHPCHTTTAMKNRLLRREISQRQQTVINNG